MPDDPTLRRLDDSRIDNLDSKVVRLDTKVERLDVKVNEIRDWLITEPEASAMGRALLRRATAADERIRELRVEHDEIHDWVQQFKGSARVMLYVPTIVSAIAAVVAIAVGMGWKP